MSLATHAVDSETELIEPGCGVPRLVCWSRDTGAGAELQDRHDAARAWADSLATADVVVAHNAVFDAGVITEHTHCEHLPRVFAAYESGQIRCTMIREALLAARRGDHAAIRNLHLDATVARRLQSHLAKGTDTWRLRFGALADVPVSEWPTEARRYASHDPVITREVWTHQTAEVGDRPLATETHENRAHWALHLMSLWGLRTDPERVTALRATLESERVAHVATLTRAGLLKPDGTGNQKELQRRVATAFERQGLQAPRTDRSARFPQGQVRIDAETCEASGDPDLAAVPALASIDKLLSTYVSAWEAGTTRPVCVSYNPVLMTDRTSCREPNVQNLPRKGGLRECIVPRPGHVFVARDWSAAELRAVAQICFRGLGWSRLRDAFLNGLDPHTELGAKITGQAVAEYLARDDVGEIRVLAKNSNFGFWGRLGARGMRANLKSNGQDVSEDRCRELKAAWHAAWPESWRYFEWTESQSVITALGGFERGGEMANTEKANTPFQSAVAFMAKLALWEVAREVWIVEDSPLYGCHGAWFGHDEICVEVPTDRVGAAADRLEAIMAAAQRQVCPDVPPAGETVAMDAVTGWTKRAKPMFDADGRLVPWRPAA